MTKRNNLDKIGGEVDTSTPVSVSGDQLSFAVPTEFVELPSGGAYYPENHPLHGQETIEIKYMTAKEEDPKLSCFAKKRHSNRQNVTECHTRQQCKGS